MVDAACLTLIQAQHRVGLVGRSVDARTRAYLLLRGGELVDGVVDLLADDLVLDRDVHLLPRRVVWWWCGVVLTSLFERMQPKRRVHAHAHEMTR